MIYNFSCLAFPTTLTCLRVNASRKLISIATCQRNLPTVHKHIHWSDLQFTLCFWMFW